MIVTRSAGALAVALLLAACGHKQAAVPHNQLTATEPSDSAASSSVYSGTGTVKSITGDRIAIAHGPISGIGWPAMTMTFTAPGGMTDGAGVGSRVDFSFRKNGTDYVLTSLKPRS